MPDFTCLKTVFHPTLKDHVITLNEIKFPKVLNSHVDTLIHNRMIDGFEEKIRRQYMEEAARMEIRRRTRLSKHTTLRIKNPTEDSLPEEPATEEWSQILDESYEGGAKEGTKKEKFKLKVPKKRFTVIRDNEIRIANPPKIKAEHPKVRTKRATLRDERERDLRSDKYNRAVDMYIEDK